MKCCRCGKEETKVLESRLSQDGKSIRRRRLCRKCEYRFTTYEKEEVFFFQIRKKNGRTEPYQRGKALRSIQIACRKRNVQTQELEFLLAKIENSLQELGDKVVPSTKLGNMILDYLSHLDQVAYIRFASVYQDFKNPSEFHTILESLT